MRILLLTLFLFVSSQLIAQEEKTNFPDSWIGVWTGELNIFSPKGIAQTLEMELHISAIEKGRWGWTIVYKGDKTDERKYELNLKDAEKAHYVIDEQNSILLDAFYLGNTLISRFSVNNALLMINYSFKEDHIVFDVFSGRNDTSILTGEEIEEVEEIRSYQMGNRQQAILYKKG